MTQATSTLTDLDYRTMEEVFLHTKPDADDGVPVNHAVGIRLVATGHAQFKDCSYMKVLKKPERYMAIVLTSRGRRIARDSDGRYLKIIEKNVDGLLKSMEAREAKKG